MSDQSAEEFRSRARAWLEAHGPRRGPGGTDEDSRGQASIPEQKAFQAKLYEAGFAGITWPVEYGGQGLTNAEQIAFSEEAREFTLPTNLFIMRLGRPPPSA